MSDRQIRFWNALSRVMKRIPKWVRLLLVVGFFAGGCWLLYTLFDCDVTIAKRRELALIRRRIGVVFQDFRLLGHLTVLENVALPLKIKGENWDRITAHAAELLAWVGLHDCIDASPLTLSGGQQQRVAIARAVISRPEILLADEPTGNVDDAIALRLLRLFEELNRHGTTVLIATHSENLMDQFDHPRLHLAGGELSGPFGGPSPRTEGV